MKVITSNRPWNIDGIYATLQQQLNPLFWQQRQEQISFKIEKAGNQILISQPDMYEGYLFMITAKDKELFIGKSEHYVDDVNQITLQSIIETLQMNIMDGNDIVYISGE